MATPKTKFRRSLRCVAQGDDGETDSLIEMSPKKDSESPSLVRGASVREELTTSRLGSWIESDTDALAFLDALKRDDHEQVGRLIYFAGSSFGRDNSPALVIAAVNCGGEVIRRLLDNGADPNGFDDKGRLPALVASASGNSECLEVLLERGAVADSGFRTSPEGNGARGGGEGEVRGRKIEEIWMVNEFKLPVPERLDRTPLHEAALADSVECVEMLLNRGVAVNRKDEDGNTALHLAVLPSKDETSGISNATAKTRKWCAEILLSNGADLCAKNNDDLSAFVAILKEAEKPIELLRKVFDKKIGPIRKSGVDDVVSIDFKPLCPLGEREQINVLYELLECDELDEESRSEIFKHPLLRAFVRRKWTSLRGLFYVYVSIYVIYALSLSAFVTLAHCDVFYSFGLGWRLKTAQRGIPLSRSTLVVTSTFVAINVIGLSYVLKNRYRWKLEMWRNTISCVLSVIVSCYTVYDGDFISITGKGSEESNSLTFDTLSEVAIEGSDIAVKQNVSSRDFNDTLFSGAPTLNTPRWIVDLTTVAVFLAWLELMLLVGRFPRWTSEALLFAPVLKNVCRLLTVYACMLLGFSFVFFLQFRLVDPGSFGDPWRSFVKTVIMMNGEFGYADMFREEKGKGWVPSRLPFLSRVIFLCFVVVASTALMNLMVAIAVSDIRGLTKKSSEIQFMKLAQSVVHWGYFIESLSKNACGRKIFRRCLERNRSIPTSMDHSFKSKTFPRQLEEDIKRIAIKRTEDEIRRTRPVFGEGSRYFGRQTETDRVLQELTHAVDSMQKEIRAIRMLLENGNSDGSWSHVPRVGRTRVSC